MGIPVLDEQALADQMRPLGEHASEVIDLWIANIPERVSAISTAAHAGVTQRLAIAAHTLRGSAMYVGAARLADRCAEIERQLHGGVPADEMDEIISQVQQEADTAVAALLSTAAIPRQG